MIEEFDLQSFINVTGTCEALRQSLIDLDTCIKDFFEDLPCNTTLCISFIGGGLSTFLKDIFGHHTEIHAWIFVSRFNSNRKPMAALLPIDHILQEASDEDIPSLEKKFKCPWGTAASVDKVLLEFKWIFREVSSGFRAANNTKPSNQRKVELDGFLDRLLSDMDDAWLGCWRFLFLGEWSNSEGLDSLQKELLPRLEEICEGSFDESVLKTFLGGASYGYTSHDCVRQLTSKSGCYIGSSTNQYKPSRLDFQKVLEGTDIFKLEECVTCEPIILVLDSTVQIFLGSFILLLVLMLFLLITLVC